MRIIATVTINAAGMAVAVHLLRWWLIPIAITLCMANAHIAIRKTNKKQDAMCRTKDRGDWYQ